MTSTMQPLDKLGRMLETPVRQAFQPDSAAATNQRVRLESLTYETECSSPAKQLLDKSGRMLETLKPSRRKLLTSIENEASIASSSQR